MLAHFLYIDLFVLKNHIYQLYVPLLGLSHQLRNAALEGQQTPVMKLSHMLNIPCQSKIVGKGLWSRTDYLMD